MINRDLLYYAVIIGLANLQGWFLKTVNDNIPAPYLDEIFHVPQAQLYWAGRWSEWDPKITTPPALYVWSYLINTVRGRGTFVTVEELRLTNGFAHFILALCIYIWMSVSGGQGRIQSEVTLNSAIIVMFPLLFFFSGLYYTDVVSALAVVLTCIVWEAGKQAGKGRWIYRLLHVVFGLSALASRQTNIFWVGIYLGGLQAMETVKRSHKPVHDPHISGAYLEDYIRCGVSLLWNALQILPRLLIDLIPQLILLFSFATFVVWNGGVVLGDKSNHVATLHLPQLLYIWPLIIFFSWPVVLARLTSFNKIKSLLPRAWVSAVVMLLMAAAVKYNTIVHPFTLADNRHYVFYVFRMLLRQWWIKYAAVPVYFICAWLTLSALGGNANPGANLNGSISTPVNSVSFTLIWLVSTALSLITAPLVEPRYFIVPWLIWRLHLTKEHDSGRNADASGRLDRAMASLTSGQLWLELAWYILVNGVTIWIFLQWKFEWPQEPDHVQRFMW